MCGIKNIVIDNFRGIQSLQADNLQKINIILGNNNSGKSSFLEAILILMGANKPSLPLEMNINRNYTSFSQEDFAMFFHDLDTNTPIKMNFAFDDGTSRELFIRYYQQNINEVKASEIQNDGKTIFPQPNYGLEYVYQDGEKKEQSTIFYDTSEKKIKSEYSESEPSKRPTFFMGSRYNFNDYISHFNQIVTDKEKDVVIESIQEIEPKIQDITVVGDKVMVDMQLNKLLPINLTGDGTRKLFTIATALYNAKNGVLIIDEVDNGLYYKSMKALWKLIISTASKLNVQVFASTHSIDSLHALSCLLTNDMPDYRKDVKIYTLRKNADDNVTCYPYEYEKFNYLLDMEEEIR